MPSQPQSIIGWDVGGAHLKAVLLDAEGHALSVVQVACPLWRGLHELDQAIAHICAQLPFIAHHHAVTMTGELVDIFANRHEGVLAISQKMRDQLLGDVHFYAGKQGFVLLESVAKNTPPIASANWLASASFLAQKIPEGLLVDIGSTTADFVVLANGKAEPQGMTDGERMRFDELVYTGVVRTPLMALCHKITFAGDEVNVAAEHFATTADVYRLTGELTPEEDMAETADGAGKSTFESARRLARMIGCDVEDKSLAEWKILAEAFKSKQLQILSQAAERAFGRGLLNANAPLIGVGAGRFLVAALAQLMQKPYRDVVGVSLNYSIQEAKASLCLPAYAVARLAQDKVV